MPLTPGTRLGRYQVVAPLGAGGMGEVYEARDTRLGRSVAIKVLPHDRTRDDDLRARFRREAESIAALKHPHVCVLYDVAEHEDVDFLVMEHLEGETLSSRLRRGPLPLGEALARGIEISSALEAAHSAGILHRDLKPGNVMLTAAGAKVLDFGLAKPFTRGDQAQEAGADAITRDQQLTVEGALLGTLGYMAPEQLEGRPAGPTSDLFALGAILWEMATGRRAFEASSQAGLIAAVLACHLPTPEPTDAELPPLLERTIARCLARDPAQRWQSAADVGFVLRCVRDGVGGKASAVDTAAEDRAAVETGARSRRARLARIAIGAAAVVALALLAALVARQRPVAGSLAGPLRLSVLPPAGTSFTPRDASGHPQFALSPDGARIAFVAQRRGESPSLWVRSLGTGSATRLAGTESANGPFWSPDGEDLAFLARGKLKRVNADDGTVRDLATVAIDVGSGSWGRAGVILFNPGGQRILRVSAEGGTVEPATALDESQQELSHRWPQFLPDGRRFLIYVGSSNPERSGAYLASLDSSDRTMLLRTGVNAVYADPGYLLFEQNGELTAQRFDPVSGTTSGQPIAISDRVLAHYGASLLALSAASNGTIAYWNGAPPPTELLWFDRAGRPLGRVENTGAGLGLALSPDATRVAVTRREGSFQDNVWRIDLASGLSSRITFSGAARFPIWSPDGETLVYSDLRMLYRKSASGAGEATQVEGTSAHWAVFPEQLTRDGRWLLYTVTEETGWDVGALDTRTGETRVLLSGPTNQLQARVSPDGRWVAYTSDDSGSWEVYVQPFPSGGGRWQVSSHGGSRPLWRADGRELFYIDEEGSVIAVPVQDAATFEAGTPERLFSSRIVPILAPFRVTYGVSPDGERFLIQSVQPNADPSAITIVLDWPAALRKASAASGTG